MANSPSDDEITSGGWRVNKLVLQWHTTFGPVRCVRAPVTVTRQYSVAARRERPSGLFLCMTLIEMKEGNYETRLLCGVDMESRCSK